MLHFVPITVLGVHSLDCKPAGVPRRLGSQYTGDTLIYIKNGRRRTHQMRDKLYFSISSHGKASLCCQLLKIRFCACSGGRQLGRRADSEWG